MGGTGMSHRLPPLLVKPVFEHPSSTTFDVHYTRHLKQNVRLEPAMTGHGDLVFDFQQELTNFRFFFSDPVIEI